MFLVQNFMLNLNPFKAKKSLLRDIGSPLIFFFGDFQSYLMPLKYKKVQNSTKLEFCISHAVIKIIS